MKSLEERLEERKKTYEDLVTAERKTQLVLDTLKDIIPEDTLINLSIYESNSFIYLSFENLEVFESEIITKISQALDVKWERSVDSDEVRYDTYFFSPDFHFYLVARAQPTDNCRITKVPTGKMKMVEKYFAVEEADFEYIVECSDE